MIFFVHLSYWANYHPWWNEAIAQTLSFFMFWFFFKGGMVFHSKPIVDSIKSGFKRLIIPYIIFTIIGISWELYIAIKTGSFGKSWIYNEIITLCDHECCWTSMACWFLLSLFFVRILFQLLYNYSLHPFIIAVISLLFASLINIMHKDYSSAFSVKPPYYIGNIFMGLAFYALGFKMKHYQFNKYLFIIALSIFLLKFFIPSNIDFRSNNYSGYYYLAVLYSLAGCIVFNNIFRSFANHRLILLTHIGHISMIYYLVHYPAAKIFQESNHNFLSSISENNRFWVMALYLIIVFCFAEITYKHFKRIRFVFGG